MMTARVPLASAYVTETTVLVYVCGSSSFLCFSASQMSAI